MNVENKETYQKLIDTGAILDRNGIDRIKKDGGRIATIYLDESGISYQIELTAKSIDKFCKAAKEQLRLKIDGDAYLGTFELSENDLYFFPKIMLENAKNVGGLWTLNEVKNTIDGQYREWITKTLEYRLNNQHLFR